MQNKMLTVSIDSEYDVLKKEYTDSIYLRLYTSLFSSTIIKDLKPTSFTVLLALSSFMDSKGNCYPTQRQIADITGISLPTINKAISTLLDYRVNGLALVSREMVQKGKYKNSYYTINPISQIAIFDGHVKDIETLDDSLVKENDVPVKENDDDVLKKLALNNNQLTITNNYISDNADIEEVTTTSLITFSNSLEVAQYFAERYEKEFDTGYKINYARDVGMIKKNLFEVFTPADLKIMVDYTISEYERLWKNDKYKRPTIGSMVAWIGQQALAIGKDKQAEQERLQKTTNESANVNAGALAKFGVNPNG